MSGQKALKGFIGPPVEFSKHSHREHLPVSRLWDTAGALSSRAHGGTLPFAVHVWACAPLRPVAPKRVRELGSSILTVNHRCN